MAEITKADLHELLDELYAENDRLRDKTHAMGRLAEVRAQEVEEARAVAEAERDELSDEVDFLRDSKRIWEDRARAMEAENARMKAEETEQLDESIKTEAALEAEVARLKMLCLSIRDAVNEYHRSGEQKAADEVERLTQMCNQTDLLDVPYVQSVVEEQRHSDKRAIDRLQAENARLRERITICSRCDAEILDGMCPDCLGDEAVRQLGEKETEASQLRQAVGLATTAKPDLVMDADDPIGMMKQIVNEVARLRDHYDKAIRANTEAVTENAQLRNTDTYQKCQSLIKERDEAWAKCHENAALADEGQAEVARLRERIAERTEAARELYQHAEGSYRGNALERWPWLEEE